MALEFLGNFTRRTLDSLRRFRESHPPAVLVDPPASHPNTFVSSGLIEQDPDLDAWDAWERAKAKMALDELGRWEKMNLAEAAQRSRVCESCGGRAENCKCDYLGPRGPVTETH